MRPTRWRRYLLRVVGQSMIGAHIADGDLLVVEEDEDPPDGAVVAALIGGGEEVTVKRLYREGDLLRLRPENGDHEVLVAFAAVFGFQLLLSVVPLYANEAGGGSSGAGLATAAFMLSTVLTQIQMPSILARYGYRRVLAAGLLFLGVPALFYAYAQTLVPILAVTLLRGVGFGIVTVMFAALIVELAPPHRRGEALGLLGVAITLPTIFCNALGLWLAGGFGYEVVFLLGGFSPLLGLGMIPWIRSAPPATKKGEESGAGFFTGLGRAPLRRIFLLFAITTMAAGVVLTFLPLAVAGPGGFSPARALLVVGITTTAS